MKTTSTAGLAAILALTILGSAEVAMAYEEPEYTVLEETDDYEIRAYEPYLVAETVVRGGFGESGGQGFRILAGYIFGDNRRSEKMAMTAPVTRRPADDSVRMNMTVPVIAERSAEAGSYLYQFVMEREYTEETLPVPNDERVTIREVPARVIAARRYSGRWTAGNFARQTEALLEALARDGVEVTGLPMSAAYNSPFTPPFLRRNEVLVEIAGD